MLNVITMLFGCLVPVLLVGGGDRRGIKTVGEASADVSTQDSVARTMESQTPHFAAAAIRNVGSHDDTSDDDDVSQSYSVSLLGGATC